MSGMLGIGVSGLQAAQFGLSTTAHNVANVNTPGFTRQEVVQSERIPLHTGAGFVGQGVNVDTIRRVYSEFLNRQVVSGQAQSSALEAFNARISQIDNLLADPSTGLSPALQDFFNGVQNVANDPGSAAARQALLGSAGGLLGRFQIIEQRLGELRSGINLEVGAAVGQINSIARQIAQANGTIALAESADAQPANDLRDQRDQLVLELNRLIGASVVQQGNSYNVFIGNGVPIVVGTNAQAIGVLNSPTEPGRVLVGVATPGGTVQMQESSLQGGSLGGLLAFRGQVLEQTENALGRIAIVLGSTFNAQHVLGQDLNGAPGVNFFNVPPPRVTSSSDNTGSAQLSAVLSNAGALTASDYLVTYTGANYVVTRLSDSTQQTFAALPATVDGVTLGLASGAPAAGDRFVLRPTVNGASGLALAITDPARIAAAAPIVTAAGGGNIGGATISAGSVNAPLNANLQQTVTITFTSATTFDVSGTGTGNPTGVAYTPGAPITYNGWSASISGTPAAGDTFTTSSNLNGISDNRNALLLAALQTQSTVANGTTSYQGAYGQLVAEVGTSTRQSDIALTAQQTFLEQARVAQQSVSGVNLDEEAANLVRYQQAYQASARVIQIGSSLFQDLLSIFA
jgi:flagellar hook-associated protein 1